MPSRTLIKEFKIPCTCRLGSEADTVPSGQSLLDKILPTEFPKNELEVQTGCAIDGSLVGLMEASDGRRREITTRLPSTIHLLNSALPCTSSLLPSSSRPAQELCHHQAGLHRNCAIVKQTITGTAPSSNTSTGAVPSSDQTSTGTVSNQRSHWGNFY